ncbi:MAG: hypothetical protein OEP95_12540 [Myxococcales bacterium]|nr:hypothetical protein [Myxococcales bacterium]
MSKALLRILVTGLGFVLACTGPPEPFETATRATMEDIVAELRVLLPLTASDERFAAPEHREAVSASLRALAAAGARLDRHGSEGDAAFGVFGHALAEDTSDALARWEAGRPDEARFLVEGLTEDCVGCHSRLAGPSSAELGPLLLAEVDRSTVAGQEWAQLLVATRQFDAALEAYEEILHAPSGPVTRLDLESVLVDYLVVCVRVAGDLGRARVTVDRVAQRTDIPRYLGVMLAAWSASLAELDAGEPTGDGLERARVLLSAADGAGADSAGMFRIGRDRLIDDLVASGDLYEFVASHPGATPIEQAEAYHWLGATELRIARSLWLSPADAYLEASIRAAPASDWAAESFDLLEVHTMFEYEGSAGLHVPEDVRERLDELRSLLESGESRTEAPSDRSGLRNS